MTQRETDHLELIAEVDALLEGLRRSLDDVGDWQPADVCRSMVQRLSERAESLRVRIDAPLVAAVLGGTGTGKSSLINALLGTEAVATGRQRPTTMRPTLLCRPDLKPEMLGIDPRSVELRQIESPVLADLVLIDCPDPDTSESDGVAPGHAESNLTRLRRTLPYCDVLLVTATQQKYRSARVADELAAAAPGARLVFVQTHADIEADIRDDWQRVLAPHYSSGDIFLVDSLAALADAAQGRPPQGDFARLRELLTRDLSGTAAARIRRANFLDLVDHVLAACRRRVEPAVAKIEEVRTAIEGQRGILAAKLAAEMRAELLGSRRQWENRLLGQTASRWGLSPFSLVLRAYQGLGALVSGSLLFRARTPAQLALWGAMQGARSLREYGGQRTADQAAQRALTNCWDATELRRAAVVLEGYAAEAGLDRRAARVETVEAEAEQAGGGFIADVSQQLQRLIDQLAQRHTRWFVRAAYETLFVAVLGLLLYRLGKNFFWDSWFAAEPVPVFGLDFYLSAAFWLLLWCLILIWALTRRLRRGLRRQLDQLAAGWTNPALASGLFARLESQCDRGRQFRADLTRLSSEVAALRTHLSLPPGTRGKAGES